MKDKDVKTPDVPDGYDSPQGRALYKRLIDASNHAITNPNDRIDCTDWSKEVISEFLKSRSHLKYFEY